MDSELQPLLDRARDDGDLRETLIERFLPDLRSFFRMRMGHHIRDRESDSDLVQSVCREVLQDFDDFRGDDPDDFRRWLFLTAYRKLNDRNKFWGRERRAGHLEVAPPADDDHTAYADLLSPSRVAMGREQLAAFEDAFDALPEEQRLVITSAKLLDKTYAEIGAEIGKSEDAVRMTLNRALARVGRLLVEHGLGPA